VATLFNCCCWNILFDLGSISSTFHAQLLRAQIPNAHKRQSSHQYLLVLLGPTRLKAAHKMLVKLSPVFCQRDQSVPEVLKSWSSSDQSELRRRPVRKKEGSWTRDPEVVSSHPDFVKSGNRNFDNKLLPSRCSLVFSVLTYFATGSISIDCRINFTISGLPRRDIFGSPSLEPLTWLSGRQRCSCCGQRFGRVRWHFPGIKMFSANYVMSRKKLHSNSQIWTSLTWLNFLMVVG